MLIPERIEKSRIVPVIALENAAQAIPLCRALEKGGLKVAEITFRTKAAPDAIKIIASQFPEFALGAGTVTRIEEVDAAKEAGAQFAVAPGLNPKIVRRAQEVGLPFFPGICTPSEIEAALDLGCSLLKYFPAGAMGGPKMLKAVHAPYAHRGVRFIPTGGISLENMKEYLACPGVAAIGGTWLVTAKLLEAGDFETITKLTREAVAVAAS